MKKKFIIVGLLAAVTALPIFAIANAESNTQNDWYNQMAQRHQQRIQQFVDNGVITADEAKQLDEHMRAVAPIMQKIYQNGGRMGPGMMGRQGMFNGMGPGGCPFAGNTENNTANNNAQ